MRYCPGNVAVADPNGNVELPTGIVARIAAGPGTVLSWPIAATVDGGTGQLVFLDSGPVPLPEGKKVRLTGLTPGAQVAYLVATDLESARLLCGGSREVASLVGSPDAAGLTQPIGADGAGHGLTTQRRSRRTIYSDATSHSFSGGFFQPLGTGQNSGIAAGDSDIFTSAVGVIGFVGGTSPTAQMQLFGTHDEGALNGYVVAGSNASAGGASIAPPNNQGNEINWPYVDFQVAVSGSPTSTTIQGIFIYGR
ncbi:MAG: hypothetical protein ACYCWW_00125 [Deltaproteobacteria bacterium]